MASIPLPALDIRPPAQQASPLEQYGQLLALRNQQQNAPLQRQAFQQQVEAGQLENQQRQLQLQDAQTLRSLSPNFVKKDSQGNVIGYDFDGLFSGAAKAGVSPQTLATLQKSISDATLAKANSSKAQLENQQTLNNQAFQHLEGLRGTIDPAERQQLWQQAVQWTAQNAGSLGINPQQLPQQAPDDNGLNTIEASLGMHAQQLTDASKTAELQSSKAKTAESQANTLKAQAETNFYAQNGGAPGVPAETVQMDSYLKNNPGKTPQDFLLWKLQHTPTAMVMGNQLGGDQNQPALDFAAQNYRQTGQMPSGLYRSPGTITAIIQRAAQLDQQQGGAGLAANSAEFKANEASLRKLQTNYDQVQSFEETASKNMDLLQQTAQKIPDLGTRLANIPVRMINDKMIGTANMAAFKTALATAQTEAAKVLNSSNATGVLSDSSRHELQDIIDGNMPLPAMVASLNTLKQDMANRTQAYQMQIGDIQRRIKGVTPSSPNAAPNQRQAPPAGATQIAPGSDGKMHYTDGKTDLGVVP